MTKSTLSSCDRETADFVRSFPDATVSCALGGQTLHLSPDAPGRYRLCWAGALHCHCTYLSGRGHGCVARPVSKAEIRGREIFTPPPTWEGAETRSVGPPGCNVQTVPGEPISMRREGHQRVLAGKSPALPVLSSREGRVSMRISRC